MATQSTKLRLFVASPSELAPERETIKTVIEEFNQLHSDQSGLVLEVVRWESHAYPGIAQDPQALLNAELDRDYDIFIGLLWKTYGTPTPRAQSGTEEEFRDALARWQSDTDSLWIAFYFKTQPVSPDDIDPEQLSKVKEFRQWIQNDLGMLTRPFKDRQQFEALFRNDITRIVRDFGTRWGTKAGITVDRPAVQSETDSSSDGLTMGSHENIDLPDLEDEGFLDLIERSVDGLQSSTASLSTMSHALEVLNDDIVGATDRLNEISSDDSPSPKEMKRVINSAAESMVRYVNIIEAVLPQFKTQIDAALQGYGRAALLLLDFDTVEEEIVVDAIHSTSEMESSMDGSITAHYGLWNSIDDLPRVTTAFNRAKRMTVDVLERLIEDMEETLVIMRDTREVLESTLAKLQER